MAKQPHEYAIGENADGTLNTFPLSELPQRMAELRELEKAALGDDGADDVSDLGDVVEAFDPAGSKKKTDAQDDWNESDHPRGQPENAGEFSSGGGGSVKTTKSSTKTSSQNSQFRNSGSQLTDAVYRGSSEQNEQQSTMSEGKGVYVTTSPQTATQWGSVKKYKIKKQPNLIDLGNFDSYAAKRLVGSAIGRSPIKLTEEEFDEEAPQIFIQNSAVDIAERMGFNGYRLGSDAFLIGKLGDHAEKIGEYRRPDIRSD